MQDQNVINQQEWENEGNWSGWLQTYRSERDTRLFVPKRNPRMGWTINFAHRGGWWYLLGLLIVPIGFTLLFLLVLLSRQH